MEETVGPLWLRDKNAVVMEEYFFQSGYVQVTKLQ